MNTYRPKEVDGKMVLVTNRGDIPHGTVATLPEHYAYWHGKQDVIMFEDQIEVRHLQTDDIIHVAIDTRCGGDAHPMYRWEWTALPKDRPDNPTFPYLTSEYNLQVEKMEQLGINTTGCTFEQSVNAALFMLKEFHAEPDGDMLDALRSTLKFTLYGRVPDDKMEDAVDDLVHNLVNLYIINKKIN